MVVLSDVHDGLIKLSLDHFVITEALLADGKLSLYIRVSLPSRALKLVVLRPEHIELLTEGLILKFRLFDDKQIVFIQVLNPR